MFSEHINLFEWKSCCSSAPLPPPPIFNPDRNKTSSFLSSQLPYSSFFPHSPLSVTFVTPKEHTCYTGNGQEYRGTASRTDTGVECGPWSLQVFYRTADYPEVIGGHNFCRNPGGRESRPWCFTNDQEMKRQLCDVPKCSEFFQLLLTFLQTFSTIILHHSHKYLRLFWTWKFTYK